MTILRLFVLMLVVTGLVTSCASWKETYQNPDRTCGYADVFKNVLTHKCEAYIKFQCTEDLTLLSYTPIKNRKYIYVKPVEGYESPYVGELQALYVTSIFIKGGSPWGALHKDVTSILNQLGYVVSDRQENANTVLVADFKHLDVRTSEGGWATSWTTHAVVTFNAALQQDTGEVLWSEEFTGKHEIKVSYAYLKDSEKTLGQAYCNALKNFADTVQTPEFYNMVN